MEDQKKSEPDCSRKCIRALQECEASGRGRYQCENGYKKCLSSCASA